VTKEAKVEEKPVTVAAVQCALGGTRAENVAKVEHLVREAAAKGARIILPPELFEGPYFCREERSELFDWSRPLSPNPTIDRFSALARELDAVIPVSFFERADPHHYNTVAMIDADGTVLGTYRKSHIPDGPGYEEKFYFQPGDTGFRVWETKHARVGVGICWDQWFPECARVMALMGAEVLLYPTAIGSEPLDEAADTRDPWQRAMVGHAVSNVIPIVAANRTGREEPLVPGGVVQSFYGSSFIADGRGDKVAELGRTEEGVITATFDLAALRRTRSAWGAFRDRRPELYGALTATSRP